jgi:HAD superfamily hydrolase (TIGR01509 family)
VDRLTDIDVHGWLRPNPLTLPTLLRWVRRTGIQLALLSDAPEPIAQAIDHSRWSRHFDHCYYSCRLGAAKPDPRAFQIVLRDLGAKPDEVLFIDDRAENTAAARNLGIRTITFTSASALDRELCLVARAEGGVPARLYGSASGVSSVASASGPDPAAANTSANVRVCQASRWAASAVRCGLSSPASSARSHAALSRLEVGRGHALHRACPVHWTGAARDGGRTRAKTQRRGILGGRRFRSVAFTTTAVFRFVT